METPRPDLSAFSVEEKQRLRAMLKTDDFRKILIEKIIVPRLMQASEQLGRTYTSRDQDMLVKGMRYAYRQFLNDCSNLAGFPNPFTLRDETLVDTTKWMTAEAKDDAVASEHSDAPTPGRSHDPFLA